MTKRRKHLVLACAALLGCGGQEAVSVELDVVASAAGMGPAENDLGWTVNVTRARLAVRDLELTVGGETHESALARVGAWLLPAAHAHPGHEAGGDVTGELPGPLILETTADGDPLGVATALTGDYEGMNLTFRRAGPGDGLDAGDPLDGHSVHLVATATRGAETIDVEIVLDIDEGTRVVGVPFEATVEETAPPVAALGLTVIDPFEGDTLFDGLDFAALDEDGDGAVTIAPGSTEHNRLRRPFQTHDHYLAEAR